MFSEVLNLVLSWYVKMSVLCAVVNLEFLLVCEDGKIGCCVKNNASVALKTTPRFGDSELAFSVQGHGFDSRSRQSDSLVPQVTFI